MHYKPVQNLLGNGRLLQIDLRQDTTQRIHGRFPAYGSDVCTHETVGLFGIVLQYNILVQRHAACVDLEDLHPSVHIRNSEFDLPVESARPAQGHVQSLGTVSGPDYYYILPLFQSIHER